MSTDFISDSVLGPIAVIIGRRYTYIESAFLNELDYPQ